MALNRSNIFVIVDFDISTLYVMFNQVVNGTITSINSVLQILSRRLFSLNPNLWSNSAIFSLIESDVMNLISVDCPNLQKALRFIHFPWSCPLQICISLYFLYDILKGAMIPGKHTVVFLLFCGNFKVHFYENGQNFEWILPIFTDYYGVMTDYH